MEEQPMMQLARKRAQMLYRDYKREEKEGCGELLLQWIQECFWGWVVREALPLFDEVWNLLKTRKHIRQSHCFVHGDIDYGVWIERCKGKRVIAATCYCAMASDNTHLYIREDSDFDLIDRFKIYRVWPRETRTCERRYIKHPSLGTHRRAKFAYGYGDCRDKGYICLYDRFSRRVEHAEFTGPKIAHALWELEAHRQALVDANEAESATPSSRRSRRKS